MNNKTLSSRDLEETLTVTRVAFECEKVDALQSEVLRLLEKMFKAHCSNFFLNTAPDQHINLNRVISRGIEERFLTQFRRYYYQLDPFLKVSSLPPAPIVLTTEQLISFSTFVRGEYYNDFLRPQSIHYQMTIWLQKEKSVLGTVALFRPRRSRNFSSSERAKAFFMAPYLAGTLEKSIIAEKALVRESVIESMVSAMPYKGIMVLDRFLDPIYRNQEAVSLLSFLPALPRDVYLSCKNLLSSKTTPPEEHFPKYDMVCIDGRRLSISLRPIKTLDNPLILLCIEPVEQVNVLSKRLRNCGLSQRELEVVFLLSQGLKNHEIGTKLFISAHTVDNHLKSIYRKMGVNNRTAAASRLHKWGCVPGVLSA
jgi:DNA-binding CsgD family transcriptional regulator